MADAGRAQGAASDRNTRWRAVVGTLIAAAIASCPAGRADASATAMSRLDQCAVIVTGTDMRSRPSGMARCLIQVLVKVSGDPTVADDPRAEEMATKAQDLAEDFVYFDRMSDVPMHDEQGSRDRPFDLVVHFDPLKIDRALAGLGRKPWRGARPVLVVGVTVADRRGDTYILSADGNAGERQRESLFAAGDLFGIRVVLLPEGRLTPGNTSASMLLARLADVNPSLMALPLAGELRWSEPDFGWVASWRLTQGSSATSWEVRGVSFDEAFRSGIRGAVGILSKAADVR